MFGIPATTAYDLRFRALGIPVRVHPLFWLVTALLGGVGQSGVGVSDVFVWIGCVFFSILVHEMGHGLSSRAFGSEPAILLYGMGGLCYYDRSERQTPWRRLIVLFCGPGAGFLLAGLTFLVYLGLSYREVAIGRVGYEILNDLLFINIVWGLVNLLPIWPLDGGQMTGVFLGMFSPANGRRWGHVISLLTAGILAVVAFRLTQDLFLTIFFAFFALANYQVLQSMHVQSRYGHADQDDDEWWRR